MKLPLKLEESSNDTDYLICDADGKLIFASSNDWKDPKYINKAETKSELEYIVKATNKYETLCERLKNQIALFDTES